ncbi:BLUF domain-containing protein [Curtobacterium sp. VKM Ac-1393]|nr:BLUF domain-containing protein [Curtobacterium sp. VKM Ac-1393]
MSRPVTDDELAEILVIAREKNLALGITGILAHQGSNCIGIIEGDDQVVRERFDGIRQDPRHTNVRQIAADTVATRSFPEWSMAFQPADPLIKEIPGFLDLFAEGHTPDPAGTASRAKALLGWFRKHPLAPLTNQHGDDAVEIRTRIVGAAITVLHGTGVEQADVDTVASRAGLSADELRKHFPTRESLLTATVDRWSSSVSRPLRPIADTHGAVAYLHALVVAYSEEPALMRLLASALAASTDPGHEGAQYYRTLYLRFRQTVREALEQDIRTGREPATMDPARATEQLLALYDGLRIQSLLIEGFDIIASFDRAVSRQRRGWAEDYRHTDLFEIPVDRTSGHNAREKQTDSESSR